MNQPRTATDSIDRTERIDLWSTIRPVPIRGRVAIARTQFIPHDGLRPVDPDEKIALLEAGGAG